jgi:hypothetical protein
VDIPTNGFPFALELENIKQPPSNIEHPTIGVRPQAGLLDVGRSMLDVGCFQMDRART